MEKKPEVIPVAEIEHKIALFDDVNRTLTISVVAQMLEGGAFDIGWKVVLLNNILSLMVYQQMLRRIDTGYFKEYQGLADDIIKTLSIIMVNTLLLKGHIDLSESSELRRILAMSLSGIIIYHLFVRPILISQLEKLPNARQRVIDFTLSEDLVENFVLFSMTKPLTKKWLVDLAYKVVGVVIYHLVIKHLNPCTACNNTS